MHRRVGSDCHRYARRGRLGWRLERLDRSDRTDSIAVIEVLAEDSELAVANEPERVGDEPALSRCRQPPDGPSLAPGIDEVLDGLLDDADVPMVLLEPRAYAACDDVPHHPARETHDARVAWDRIDRSTAADRRGFEARAIGVQYFSAYLRRPMCKPSQQLITVLLVRELAGAQISAAQGNRH